MTTTSSKQIDRFGNISYTVTRDGEVIGTIYKESTGYRAELLSGSWMPASSIKKAAALLTARA